MWRASLVFAILFVTEGAVNAVEKNKCGCYRDSSGACFCDKAAKCGCPGDCEPKQCEQQRDKELQKEVDAETKKALEAARKTKGHTKGQDGEGSQPAGAAGSKAAREPSAHTPPAAVGHKLTPAQVKHLAKLLDKYLVDHPDARSKTSEELRNELVLTPR